jgi:hypothetical protein
MAMKYKKYVVQWRNENEVSKRGINVSWISMTMKPTHEAVGENVSMRSINHQTGQW